ncbi:MAG TPA: FAD-binding oxidoreductase, partial [Streptosporangiaceae bacterium]
LATGAAGPLRLRYGTPRDLLLGITVVRADGTVAKSGGKVVKNVAGYDLGKLFAGSRGTLGLITQATFRLHPVPVTTAYVTVQRAAAVDACQAIGVALESPVAPVAVEIDWPSAAGPVTVSIALEGDPTGVAQRAAALADLLGRTERSPAGSGTPPPWWGAGPAAQPDGTVLQVAFWPGDLGMVLAEIRAAAEVAGLDPAVGGSAAAGLLHMAFPADRDPGAIAAFVAGLRAAVGHGLRPETGHRLSDVPKPLAHARAHTHSHAHGRGAAAEPAGPGEPRSGEGPPARANVVVLHAPPAVGALVDLFGPVPSLGLMRAIKDQFDPHRVMSPGRFAGGI